MTKLTPNIVTGDELIEGNEHEGWFDELTTNGAQPVIVNRRADTLIN